jgi:hypothetical protein
MSTYNSKNKKLVRKFNRYLLEFKALDDTYEDACEEEQEGERDLLFRVSDFQKRLSKDKQQLFKENVLGAAPADAQLQKSDKVEVKNNSAASEDDIVPSKKSLEKTWQKKLLRAIVVKTHPDKLLHFPDDDKLFYTEVCRIAMESFEAAKDVKLMAAGHDVRVKPANLSTFHLKLIADDIQAVKKKISHCKLTHGYIWYHLTEIEKEVFLTNYLAQLGFKAHKEEVKAAIKARRPNARKPGTRPVNMLKKRVNKTS